MQVLAETMVGLNERIKDKQYATLHILVDQVTHGLDRFVDRSSAGADSFGEAKLKGLLDEAAGLETQWHDLEQQFDAKTRRGEQVQREMIVASYRARFVGLQYEIERWQQASEKASGQEQRSIDKSLVGLRAGLPGMEAKINVFETADLDGWRGLRRGLQRAFQQLEKKLSALEEEMR